MKTAASSIARVGLTLCFLLAASGLAAQTNVSGTISTSTTWTLAGSPYIVTGDIYVQNSAAPVPILTIQAGVTVKFNSGTNMYIGWSYPGGLQAVGTSSSPIVFTANGSTTPGFWRGIQLSTSTSSTQISYATVSYGGVNGAWGGIHVNGCSPTISNVTASNNMNGGVTVNGGAPTITSLTSTGNQWGMVIWGSATASVSSSTLSSNTVGGIYLQAPVTPSLQTISITNNTGFAMSQDAGVTLGTVSGITATGNTTNAVEVRASTAGANATWQTFGLPYVVTGDVYVQKSGGPAAVLTIQAGVTVKFNSGVNFYIGWSYPGGLQAVGTSASPIVFTANGSTSPGFWRGIQMGGSTSSTQISYATVSYGGLTNNWGGIHVIGCSPTISNVTASNNMNGGVTVNGGAPTITSLTSTGNQWGMVIWGSATASVSSSTLSSNTAGGIYLQAPVTPSLQTVSITNNTGFAISQDAGATLGTVSGITATGNTNNAVEVRGSTASANTTWRSFGLPYIVTGDVNVQKSGGPAAILTIQPGVTVKFNSGINFYIGWSYPGGLQAVGTSASPIVFTANGSTTPGFWRGIQMGTQTSGTQISFATVSYGGLNGNWGGIHVLGCSPTISNVTASNNMNGGVTVNGGAPTITSLTSTGNQWGMVIWGSATASVSSSTLSSNTVGGI